jgi:DNA-binding NarL/FixJ family response regulator
MIINVKSITNQPPLLHETVLPVILIVEDSLPMRQVLTDLIAIAYPQGSILQAGSAEAALELIASHRPDLVLMDIALPGMDGLTCLQEIKRLVPTARSVVISYHEEQPYQQKSLHAGADHYISKRKLYLDLMPAIHSLLDTEMEKPL